MARLTRSAHLDAPVELVYQVVADVEQYPAFLADVASVEKRGDVVAMTLQMGLMPIALVTGGSNGLGTATALALGKRGVSVMLTGAKEVCQWRCMLPCGCRM